MIIRKIPVYHFQFNKLCNSNNLEFLKEHFYIHMPTEIFSELKEKIIVSFPGALEIRIIKRSYTDNSDDTMSLKKEGCFFFNENDEYILEAECIMETMNKKIKDTFFVRLPMSAPFIKNSDIQLYFDGTWLKFLKNGEILNENSCLDRFCDVKGEAYINEKVTISTVNNVTVNYREEKNNMTMSFYFPHGWNTNVGDVMTFSSNGVCHIMYLTDRRNHGSRNGQGAHYISHMTSKNLKDWYEQIPIAEIDEPWKTFGTGTMVFHDDKYYMTYGLHTERYLGDTEKIEPMLINDEFKITEYKDIFKQGGIPAGASYSVSEDGINFIPSKKLIHTSRNPSAYVNEDGKIIMYCGYGGDGVWEAENFNVPFKKCENNFIFSGKDVVMQNSSECPAFVNWNGYKYLIVGFTGYYRTFKKGSNDFKDATALGENIYDGLSVPMVYEYGNNRRIIAGWIKSPFGWGGALVQRELIQNPDGSLGMKWVHEFLPDKISDNIFDKSGKLPTLGSYILEMTIHPHNSKKIGLLFSEDKTACILQLDSEKCRAQFSDTTLGKFADEIPTAYEQMIMYKDPEKVIDTPKNCRNYSIPDITGIKTTFTIRMLIRYSNRLKATVIDAEIAGERTMISVRADFKPDTFSIISDGEILVDNEQLHLSSWNEE